MPPLNRSKPQTEVNSAGAVTKYEEVSGAVSDELRLNMRKFKRSTAGSNGSSSYSPSQCSSQGFREDKPATGKRCKRSGRLQMRCTVRARGDSFVDTFFLDNNTVIDRRIYVLYTS